MTKGRLVLKGRILGQMVSRRAVEANSVTKGRLYCKSDNSNQLMVLKHSSPGMRKCGAPYQTAVVNQHRCGQKGRWKSKRQAQTRKGVGEEGRKGKREKCGL